MNEAVDFVVKVMGAGIAIVPLFATVWVINGAVQGLGKLGGLLTDSRRGKGLKERADKFRERQEGRREINALDASGRRSFSLGKYQRRAKREAIDSGIKSEVGRSRGTYVATQAIKNEGFRNRLAGGDLGVANASPEAVQRALGTAINVKTNVEADEVKAANAVIKDLNLSQAQLQQLAMGGNATNANGEVTATHSEAMQIAAIQRQSQSTVGDINQLLDHAAAGNMSAKAMQTLADNLQTSGAKPAYVGAMALENLRQGQASSADDLVRNAVNSGAYSKEKIASVDKDEIQFVAHAVATDPSIGSAAKAKIQDNAKEALQDAILNAKIGKSEGFVTQLRDGNDPGPL